MSSSNMLRRWLCGLALAALVAACSARPDASVEFVDSLGAAFERSAAARKPIRIAELTGFEWNRMFVFPARSPLSAIYESLGGPVPYDIFQARVSDRDDISLIIFLRGESIAAWVALEKAKIDLVVPEGTGALTPADAVFLPSPSDRTLALADAQGAARKAP